MLVFLKLGGSLITDKNHERSFRRDTVLRIGDEILSAFACAPQMQLVIGHGSGSFGHFAAKRLQTASGVRTKEEWIAFAEVAAAAADLNHLVRDALRCSGLPVWSLQPSASALSRSGEIQHMSVDPIRDALRTGLIPLVYGDVCLDVSLGGTIVSTEKVLSYLATHLRPSSILLLGEVDGVYDQHGNVVPVITADTLPKLESALRGSSGVDVTGGMETKVRDMISLARQFPSSAIRVMSGTRPGLVVQTLCGMEEPGTLFRP